MSENVNVTGIFGENVFNEHVDAGASSQESLQRAAQDH